MLSIKYVQFVFTVILFMLVKKGLIHPKMIVIPNLYDFISSLKHKNDQIKNKKS